MLRARSTHYQTGIHSGYRPNMSADVRTVMTPKKNDTLSLVLNVLELSQLWVRLTSLEETCSDR